MKIICKWRQHLCVRVRLRGVTKHRRPGAGGPSTRIHFVFYFEGCVCGRERFAQDCTAVCNRILGFKKGGVERNVPDYQSPLRCLGKEKMWRLRMGVFRLPQDARFSRVTNAAQHRKWKRICHCFLPHSSSTAVQQSICRSSTW